MSLPFFFFSESWCIINLNSVKSLSKSGNARKDQAGSSKDSSSLSVLPTSAEMDPSPDLVEEVKAVDISSRRAVEKENAFYNYAPDYEKPLAPLSSSYPSNGRSESLVTASGSMDRERFNGKNSYGGSTSQRMNNSSYSQNSVDMEEKVQKASPPRRKGPRDEKLEKLGSWMKKDGGGSDLSTSSLHQKNTGNYNNPSSAGARQYEPEPTDGDFSEILEV